MATVKQQTVKNTRELRLENKATGTVMTKGNLLAITAGLAVDADNGTVVADLLGLCNDTISVADAETRVEIIKLSDEDTFLIDTANNSNADHNNQAMVLSDATTANNTGTTSATGIVVQVEPFGAASDKQIICRFVTL